MVRLPAHVFTRCKSSHTLQLKPLCHSRRASIGRRNIESDAEAANGAASPCSPSAYNGCLRKYHAIAPFPRIAGEHVTLQKTICCDMATIEQIVVHSRVGSH